MKQSSIKPIYLWFTGIIIFILGFYLSSQRQHSPDNNGQHLQQGLVDSHQTQGVKQKLANDFEAAFFKQYTPPVGCELHSEDNQSALCQQHMQQAKNSFKEDFIKNRGLPKDTFEELKLSFRE